MYEDPTPNLPLLRKVLDHIDAHPEEWTQLHYAIDLTTFDSDQRARMEELVGHPLCDTPLCVAGHAVAMTEGLRRSGGNTSPLGGGSFRDAARRHLGLTEDEAYTLFHGTNTREDVQRAARQIAARAGEEL